jgi:hypothetical protein
MATGGRNSWTTCVNLNDEELSDYWNRRYRKKASSLYFGKGDYVRYGPDTETINDHCCRLYTRPDFDMTWIWDGNKFFHDFCLDESYIDSDESKAFNLSDVEWITSIRSWRCGA